VSDVNAFTDVEFRRVLGHFATGLTIIACCVDGHPFGFTCQSFASVSLDPPLISFFAHKESGSWAGIRDVGRFSVNMLSDQQVNLARIFAVRGADKFNDVEWTLSPAGMPIIKGGIAWLDCTVESVFDAGDHDGVLGRVRSLEHENNAAPLIYFRGGYGDLGS
jgi:3-hydroxy-9,10-secoandrosta-1,3,5(10)-triene-9,17-dione monooxygenase reductase component